MYINKREVIMYKSNSTINAQYLSNRIYSWIDSYSYKTRNEGERLYLNLPISFDIETSSVLTQTSDPEKPHKNAYMYIWQMSINGGVILGRTWEQWGKVMEILYKLFSDDGKYYIPIYVHNLSFEFQFIRKLFEWEEVFAIKNRKPIFARTNGFEFRCSYFLSNANLEFLGSNMIHHYHVEKKTGDLDYSITRTPDSQLTSEELEYCINDVLVVTSYIQELIESEGGIGNIPYTSTGFVRNYVRNKCYPTDSNGDLLPEGLRYKAIMRSLTIPNYKFYNMCKRAFMGGFTHANCMHVNEICMNITSFDIASSYPFIILSKKFPITKFRKLGRVSQLTHFKKLLEKFHCIFDVTFYDLKPKVIFENILSKSKCLTEGNYLVNNGRLVSSDKCTTTLTEVDWKSIINFYTFSSFQINDMWVADSGYLPKPIIESTLDFYEGKTSLKGVEGKEIEYMKSKNKLNAIFGMMVTDIMQDQFNYSLSNEWNNVAVNVDSQLSMYNSSHSRFLYYPWGIYITAYARERLFNAILECKEDYIYADTDSVKIFNVSAHEEYFNKCDKEVKRELLQLCLHYNINFERCRPKTPKGVKKLIGVWENEGTYKYFKTCGAKRYMYTDSKGDNLSLTVSGLNKKFAIPYLISEYGETLSLELFGDGMVIPPGHTGKNLLTYIDEERTFEVTDYENKTSTITSPSSIHFEPEGYYFSMAADYLRFLSGLEFWDK